jgi:uncharacterized protein
VGVKRRGPAWVLRALLGLAWAGTACERPAAPARPVVDSAGATRTPTAPPSPASAAVGTPPPSRCVAAFAPAPPAQPATECPPDPGPAPVLPHGQIRFEEAPGQPTVQVELALTANDQMRGLMYRTQMPADEGMLFTFEDERPRQFWMRNTCIPLDMAFIDSQGYIAGILENVPTLNTLPRGVSCPATHVLELNAGWARAHGVAPGQHVAILR